MIVNNSLAYLWWCLLRDSPPGQQHRGGALPLEHTIHQHAILAVTRQIELLLVVEQLQVPSRYETRVSHVHIDLAAAGVAPDHDALLPDQVLEVAAIEPRDGHRRGLLGPLHLGRRRRRRLEREQRPSVALRTPRELSLSHVTRYRYHQRFGPHTGRERLTRRHITLGDPSPPLTDPDNRNLPNPCPYYNLRLLTVRTCAKFLLVR